MKQVFIRKGNAIVEEVPAPCVESGRVFVQTQFSCISPGTEMSSVANTSKPLWKRAIQNPEEVKKAINMVRGQGVRKTRQVVEGRLEAGNAVGYSAAGIVLEAGPGVKGFMHGDRVACAGTGYAYHAEYISVPSNLTVKVPDSVNLADAASVALGAIAMQGVRRAQPTLGETFVVIGLGALGQLVFQFLVSNGCSVFGMDLDPDRGESAKNLGLTHFISSGGNNGVEEVFRLTDGYGTDGVIIAAASLDSKIVSQAFKMCRKKGRVVLVGDVGLSLQRGDFYKNEIDFLISTSYGPGRYDENYEEGGVDYPFGYVRWTEKRNMKAYIRLLESGRVKVSPLIHKIVPVDKADSAYEMLKSADKKPMMVILSYPDAPDQEKSLTHVVINPLKIKKAPNNKVRLALIGAGGFAKGVHLPNLQSMPDLFQLKAVISRSGHNARNAGTQYKAEYCGTDYHHVLADPDIDAVLIATRHNLHAPMVLEALEAGKHVLVEKPLALKQKDLDAISNFYRQNGENGHPILLTGFNRRFSPFMRACAEEIRMRTNPVIVNYRMNAGYIPLDHWVHSEEGGGRNLGEACHIYDLFTYLTESEVVDVRAFAVTPKTKYYTERDNFTAVVSFKDGSVCSLTYTSLGSRDYPKELMELYVDGKVIYLNDYKKLEFFGGKGKGIKARVFEKGQKEELAAFGKAVMNGGEWPIPLWQQVQAAQIALRVEKEVAGRVTLSEEEVPL
ncbi:oxidoreductase [Candidatus Parcubacteria bacterium]|nr:MAG: oxidoreductase [Candidatus Parcubacteria bacterium]